MVGAKATNALSKMFCVQSVRDGKIATAMFEKGELKDYKKQLKEAKEAEAALKAALKAISVLP